MSAEDIANALHRNPELSNSQVAYLLTAMQGLRDSVVEDFSTNLILQSDETRTRRTVFTVDQGQTSSETRTRHLTRTGTTMLRRIPSPQNFYPLIHTEVGAGALTFPNNDTKFGGRCDADGTNYITVDDHSRLNPTDTITISGWAYLTTSDATRNDLICKGNVDTNVPYRIVRLTNGDLSFAVTTSSTEYGITITPSVGSWIHFAMTWKGGGDNRLRLYIDKVKQGSDVTTGATLDTNSEKLGVFAEADGGRIMQSGTRLAQLSMLHGEATQSWIDDHYDGILNTDTTQGGLEEILTIPFNGDAEPRPDATFGFGKV